MKKEDAKYVLSTIDNEGFDYCFNNYSSFDEISDEEFHNLRKAYLASGEALLKYLKESKTNKMK